MGQAQPPPGVLPDEGLPDGDHRDGLSQRASFDPLDERAHHSGGRSGQPPGRLVTDREADDVLMSEDPGQTAAPRVPGQSPGDEQRQVGRDDDVGLFLAQQPDQGVAEGALVGDAAPRRVPLDGTSTATGAKRSVAGSSGRGCG